MYISFSILFTIAALVSFVNYRYLKLTPVIGQLILGLVIASGVWALKPFYPEMYQSFGDLITAADFKTVLLDVMLGFLLFAGALHVDITALKEEKWSVLLFATVGVLISTFIVGGGLYLLSGALSCQIPFIHCLLFGSLISPTDPIAVLALLKNMQVKKSLQLKIEGESLFNDGIGVITFTAILLIANVHSGMDVGESMISTELLHLVFEELIVGLLLGGVIGFIAYHMMKVTCKDAYLTTILSLAVVFGGYSIASLIGTSGPLAMVVAGLYLGHKIKGPNFSDESRVVLSGFWKVLDESLNGVLFVFMGLAIHIIKVEQRYLVLMLLSLLLILIARFISVLLPYALLKHKEDSWIHTTYLLTWGGLRGGISLALAFSLSAEYSYNSILLLTYGAVIFSILVQGTTMPRLVKRLAK